MHNNIVPEMRGINVIKLFLNHTDISTPINPGSLWEDISQSQHSAAQNNVQFAPPSCFDEEYQEYQTTHMEA